MFHDFLSHPQGTMCDRDRDTGVLLLQGGIWYVSVFTRDAGVSTGARLWLAKDTSHCDEPIRHVVMASDNDAASRGRRVGWTGQGQGQERTGDDDALKCSVMNRGGARAPT